MAENMVKIRDRVYLVRTQAGFRKAAKDFHRNADEFDKKIYNFPKTYPSLVILNSFYNGGNYVTCCECFHIDQLKEIIDLDTKMRAELAKQKEEQK